MPLYNHKEFVGMAIESILQQTFKDFELIVIDDGSTDDGAKVVKKYMARDKRIRLHQQANGGFGMACNAGLRLARGRYVVWQDADDFSHPDKLQLQYDFLEKNKNIGGLNVSYTMLDAKNNIMDLSTKSIKNYLTLKIKTGEFSFYYDDRRLTTNLKGSFNLFYGNTMFRKKCYDKVGWHRNVRACGDRDMFWRLQEKYQIVSLETTKTPLYLVRTHQQQTTNRTKKKLWGRLRVGLGHSLITLSCLTRRVYGRDPLDNIPTDQPIARLRYIFYFLFYPRIFYYYFRNKFYK